MNQKQTDKATKSSEKKHIPWWVSILCAIATYCTLKYVLPELAPANQKLKDLFQLGPVVAPLLTIPFLLLSAKQLYDTELPEEKFPEENDDDT
jgi:hypothetical protein